MWGGEALSDLLGNRPLPNVLKGSPFRRGETYWPVCGVGEALADCPAMSFVFVFCICRSTGVTTANSTNKYQKYKSVELGDQLGLALIIQNSDKRKRSVLQKMPSCLETDCSIFDGEIKKSPSGKRSDRRIIIGCKTKWSGGKMEREEKQSNRFQNAKLYFF